MSFEEVGNPFKIGDPVIVYRDGRVLTKGYVARTHSAREVYFLTVYQFGDGRMGTRESIEMFPVRSKKVWCEKTTPQKVNPRKRITPLMLKYFVNLGYIPRYPKELV